MRDIICERIPIYDNFTSGKDWHIADIVDSPKVTVVRDDIKDLERLVKAMAGSDTIFHFASNPDIAKAMTQLDVDFWEGTYLTQNILEAMQINGVRKFLYV
jgi:UDP-glucose 4-epimerase